MQETNEWIKIECEWDLPDKSEVKFHVAKDKRVFNSPVNYATVIKWWYSNKISHYQPIIKPQPPIY